MIALVLGVILDIITSFAGRWKPSSALVIKGTTFTPAPCANPA